MKGYWDHTEPASPAAAPRPLETVRAFVNTLDVEEGTDELETVTGLAGWLGRNGFSAGRLTRADLARALDLRATMRSMLEANHEDGDFGGEVATLNRIADRAKVRPMFDAGGARLEPSVAGVDAVLGQLVAIVFHAVQDGLWPRLKICRNDTCRWAFYDNSRNRSGMWCSMAVCGNREKVSRYRQRTKSS